MSFFRRKGLWDRASHLLVVTALVGAAFRGREMFGFVAGAFQCCNLPLFVVLIFSGPRDDSVLLARPFGTTQCLFLSQRPFWAIVVRPFWPRDNSALWVRPLRLRNVSSLCFCPVFGTARQFFCCCSLFRPRIDSVLWARPLGASYAILVLFHGL